MFMMIWLGYEVFKYLFKYFFIVGDNVCIIYYEGCRVFFNGIGIWVEKFSKVDDRN